jgi:hypothetical protein
MSALVATSKVRGTGLAMPTCYMSSYYAPAITILVFLCILLLGGTVQAIGSLHFRSQYRGEKWNMPEHSERNKQRLSGNRDRQDSSLQECLSGSETDTAKIERKQKQGQTGQQSSRMSSGSETETA